MLAWVRSTDWTANPEADEWLASLTPSQFTDALTVACQAVSDKPDWGSDEDRGVQTCR
jgi:hypothetical protein